jgi:diaminopimelate epimerase
VRSWSFAKGHGTQNDFVLLVDREDMLRIGPEEVRRICDRRAGIGGDGLLRAVLAKHVDGWDGDGEVWFMDYRNADGSVAEMCGNGLRVFVRYLVDEGLALGPVVPVATRAGLREAELLADGRIRVAMGPVVVADELIRVSPAGAGPYPAVAVDVGNPHAVSFLDDPAALAALDLSRPPAVEPAEAFPEGVNAEFVTVLGDRHLRMRVHERGSGETRSCGTGTVAAAAAAARRVPGRRDAAVPATYRVEVPGGAVEVELGEQAHLTGPAVLVAHGVLSIPEEG